MTGIVPIALLAGFVGILAAAAISDARTMRIPNRLSLGLIAAFLPFGLAAGLDVAAIGIHLLVGLGVLVATFTMFALGWIGGGDAKLAAAVAVWFGLPDIGAFLFATAIAGGVLTLAIIGLRVMPVPIVIGNWLWLTRLQDKSSGVPYGIAIAAGAFLILPESQIWRLAFPA